MLIKKLIALFYSILMLLGLVSVKPAYTLPVTVEGAIFANGTVQTELQYDDRWLTASSDTKYNADLAAFSALLCADSYFRAKDLSKGTQNRVLINGRETEYTQTALLEALGYTDVKYIETFKAKSYAYDSNDSATITLGYKNVDGKYDTFIVVLRGCFSAGERLSAFDVGSASAAFTGLTGEHPEWKNTDRFKGFDIAANRADEFIAAYMAEHDDPERQNTALFTGHSRGASVAGILGAEYEKNADVKSYTYTFNSMPVTADKTAPSYKTIFNIFDVNDYYSDPLPFGSETYYRYGKDISLDMAVNDEIRSAVAEIKGADDYACMSPEAKSEYDKLFGERFPTRESLYEMTDAVKIFDTLEEAQNALKECASLSGSSGLALSSFCQCSEITENGGKYEFTFRYCGAALLYGFAEIEAYGKAAYTAFVTLFADDAAACRLAQLIEDNLTGMTAGHLLVNGYVLSAYGGKSGIC